MAYPHLFSPLTVGPLRLPHRIVMLPHAGFADVGEKPGTRTGQYLAERAKNGAAWIVTGLAVAHPHLLPRGVTRGGWDDSIRPYLETIVGWVKPHGAYLTTQLSHSGHNGPGADQLKPNWSASQVPSPFNLETPLAIRQAEIDSVVEYFARTARNFQAAGIDGLEVQTAGDYLLGSFLSPVLNHRTDDYGGPLENRARLVLDVLRAIRAEVGPGFALGIRTSGTRLIRGFDDTEDCLAFCRLVAESGLIDFISVMHGSYYDHLAFGPSMRLPRGNALPSAARIRAATGLPVIAANRLDDAAFADRAIADGATDLIGIARGLLADPAWIRKVREGRLDDIRPCIACNHCNARLFLRKEGQCAVNPQMGQEARFGDDQLRSAGSAKRIVVVGGGPAGMEAARVAALRGHHVTLYEASDRLGGQIVLAARAPFRQDLIRIVEWQARQLAALGVDVRCQTPIDANHPALADADHIVVATGSTPERLGISLFYPGYGPIQNEGATIVTSWEALSDPETLGAMVLVVDEDLTQAGPSIALHLAHAGKRVQIATTAVQLGLPELERTNELHQTLEDLLRAGVTIHPFTAVRRAAPGRVVVEHVLTREEREIVGIDAIVLVTGWRSNTALLDALLAAGRPAIGVGDCLAPRRLIGAIHDGFFAGASL
ncbi:MAG: NADH:flavin oxidoreductase / NADH oxidase [Dehalococcoidia bacterium]|nr:MAG: NADH:flavin oxidoreductase / NADH oxidase [Dehalococcoidia bacterium]